MSNHSWNWLQSKSVVFLRTCAFLIGHDSLIVAVPTPLSPISTMANITAADVLILCPGVHLPPEVVKLDLADLLQYPECAGMTTALSMGQEEDNGYPIHTRIIMTFIFACLSMIGIVGNCLVITVVLKVPGMITPTNCYLVSLALSDCLFFVATAPTELSYLHVPDDYLFGSVGCAFFSYLPFLAINSSSLSIAAFTIERFIGICYPIQARYICTVKRAKMIIAGIWAFCIIYNSPWLYLATLKQDQHGSLCDFKMERSHWTYQTLFFADFFAFYIIPMFLYMVIYGKIAFTLKKNDIRFRCKGKSFYSNSGSHKSTTLTVQGTAATTPAQSTCDFQITRGGVKGSSKKSKNSVVKMLALVVIVFAVCWLPYRAMVMYNSFANCKFDSEWYIFFSKTMIFINCAINPIVYNLMSGKFRNAFKKFFGNHNARTYYQRRHSVSRLSTSVGC
ncbi:hypothetical protein L596_010093 [Steinernema carpocapsae]|uniref:Thyrotropin-releasing hormone receptor n=1 Tax=Steinernema carpocapsae TaxID=34508 RepID=A0A4U5PHK8_STECR|nr:hypothetical protein L596_010093 [Steinernema carpocapsae]